MVSSGIDNSSHGTYNILFPWGKVSTLRRSEEHDSRSYLDDLGKVFYHLQSAHYYPDQDATPFLVDLSMKQDSPVSAKEKHKEPSFHDVYISLELQKVETYCTDTFICPYQSVHL